MQQLFLNNKKGAVFSALPAYLVVIEPLSALRVQVLQQ